jgi:hypothetical protein
VFAASQNKDAAARLLVKVMINAGMTLHNVEEELKHTPDAAGSRRSWLEVARFGLLSWSLVCACVCVCVRVCVLCVRVCACACACA